MTVLAVRHVLSLALAETQPKGVAVVNLANPFQVQTMRLPTLGLPFQGYGYHRGAVG